MYKKFRSEFWSGSVYVIIFLLTTVSLNVLINLYFKKQFVFKYIFFLFLFWYRYGNFRISINTFFPFMFPVQIQYMAMQMVCRTSILGSKMVCRNIHISKIYVKQFLLFNVCIGLNGCYLICMFTPMQLWVYRPIMICIIEITFLGNVLNCAWSL